jgi:hypothetical protein
VQKRWLPAGDCLAYLPGAAGGDTWVVVGHYRVGLQKEGKGWKVNKCNLSSKTRRESSAPRTGKAKCCKWQNLFKSCPSRNHGKNNRAVLSSLEGLNIEGFMANME